MTLHAVGLSHHSAPVAVREPFAFDPDARRRLYARLGRKLTADAEVVLVSTCNRTEAYLYGTDQDVETLRAALVGHAGVAWPEQHAFTYHHEQAVRHVLAVTAGLRSLVLGDAQILSQVKDAYRAADDEGRLGPVMHRLLHTAFRAAKRVKTETGLGLGRASVSSAAVAAAAQHFGGRLDGRRALLVGTGQMGQAALKALAQYRLAGLQVTNRSAERAASVAHTFGADTVDWAERHAAAGRADLVLVASGADAPTITAAYLPDRSAEALAFNETLVLDVALPRNVEPAVDALPGYRVIDLDRLSAVSASTRAARQREVPHAEEIVEGELAQFVAWVFHQQALAPAVQQVRATFEAIRQQEIERHAHRFESADREDLDRLTRSIMQKLLAVPVVRLKTAQATDDATLDYARGVRALASIFARPDCAEEQPHERQARTDAEPIVQPAPVPLPEPDPQVEGGCPLGYDRSAASPATRPGRG